MFRRLLFLTASPLPLMGTQYVTVGFERPSPYVPGRRVEVRGWRL